MKTFFKLLETYHLVNFEGFCDHRVTCILKPWRSILTELGGLQSDMERFFNMASEKLKIIFI